MFFNGCDIKYVIKWIININNPRYIELFDFQTSMCIVGYKTMNLGGFT